MVVTDAVQAIGGARGDPGGHPACRGLSGGAARTGPEAFLADWVYATEWVDDVVQRAAASVVAAGSSGPTPAARTARGRGDPDSDLYKRLALVNACPKCYSEHCS